MKIDKLKKIKALAESGSSGEREAARRVLDRMLDRHGIDESSLEEPERKRAEFAYRTLMEKRLLMQLAWKFITDWDGVWRQTKGRRNVILMATEAEADAICVHYAVYRKELKSVVERAFAAFIQANNILPPNAECWSEDNSELTAEEVAKIRRMMKAIDPVETETMLNAGG